MKSSSQSRAIPDPTLALFLVAAGLVWALLAQDETVRIMILLALLIPFGLWFTHRLATSAATGAALLVVASAMPRFTVEIGGMKARPEHIAAGLLCLTVPFLLKQRQKPTPWIYADYLLLAYLALNLFSSVFESVAPQQTLKTAVQQALVVAPYFLLRILAADRLGFRRVFRVFLIVGALEAAYGVVCYYSYLLLRTEFGVAVGQYGDIPGPYGTQYEANILGAYCAASAVVMLAMYVQERRRAYLVGYAITLAGMAIGLSRAALGATAVGLALLALWAKGAGALNRRVLLSIGTATLAVALVILPALASSYVERFSTVDVGDITADDNTAYRVTTWALALDNFARSPVFGRGTGSFLVEYGQGDPEADRGLWISNTELRVLHDTGIVGFTVFLLFLAALARRAWRLLKHGPDPAFLALLLGAAAYCISFQMTEGTLLAFTWVHLGLIACTLSMPQASGDELPGRLAGAGKGGPLSDSSMRAGSGGAKNP